MIPASLELLDLMRTSRPFTYSIEIDFLDQRVVTLTEYDLLSTGNRIIQSPGVSSLPIGTAMSKCLTLSFFNLNERFANYVFYGAKIKVRATAQLSESQEDIDLGTFTVTEPETYGTNISLTAYDNMYKADRPFVGIFPMSAQEMYIAACEQSGLLPETSTFHGHDYGIETAPEDMSCRQALGYCAMLAGGNAVCDGNGVVIAGYDAEALSRLISLYGGTFDGEDPYPDDGNADGEYFRPWDAGRTYGDETFNPWNDASEVDGGVTNTAHYVSGDEANGGTFNPWNVGYTLNVGTFNQQNAVVYIDDVYSKTIGTDDVVITGIRITGEDQTYTSGTEGYMIDVTLPIATGNEQAAVNTIGEVLIGLRFRPYSLNTMSYPFAEVGDPISLDGRYPSMVTDVEFNFKGTTALKCTAESPIRNTSSVYFRQTKAVLKLQENLLQEKTAREAAVENLLELLENSPGLYYTPQVDPSTGATTYYLHDKPTLNASQIIFKLNSQAIAISNDGGQTWPFGVIVNGNVIANILSANGINADWIRSGSLKLQGAYGSSGATALIANDTDLDINILLLNQAGLIARGIPICAIRKYAYSDGHYSYTKLENGELSIGFTTNPSNLSGSYTTQLGYIALMTSSAGYHSIAFHTNNNNDEIFIGPFAGGLQVYNNAVAHRDNYFNVYPNIIGNTQAFFRDLYCYSLYCSPSSKSCYIETDDYGTRLQYTYETASPYFGDIGDAETDENGICYVQIDDIMRETTSEDTHYSVFLQKEGPGDIWVDTKATDYFVVKGTPNLRFSWEIKMRQKEGSYKRLELLPETSPDDIDYASEAEQVYEEYLSEMEA